MSAGSVRRVVALAIQVLLLLGSVRVAADACTMSSSVAAAAAGHHHASRPHGDGQDHGSRPTQRSHAPCDVPCLPAACVSVPGCGTAAESVRSLEARLASHDLVVSQRVLAPRSVVFSPETPPPRA